MLWAEELAVCQRFQGISLEYLKNLRYQDPNHYFFILTLHRALGVKEARQREKKPKLPRKGKR